MILSNEQLLAMRRESDTRKAMRHLGYDPYNSWQVFMHTHTWLTRGGAFPRKIPVLGEPGFILGKQV